ncbi:MAG TPA: NAD(P)H-dependent oxidoreductase [Kineosporiaceae bacterium]
MPGALAVVGNPRPGSRTATVARAVLQAVIADLGSDAGQDLAPAEVVDLGELLTTAGAPLGEGSGQRYADALARLHGARLAVLATPTDKGSYTGLLKAFLDHVAAGALRRTVAVPLITVGSPAHTLAADVHLRPLLVELGALVPTAAVVVQERDLADPDDVIGAWLDGARPALRALLGAGGPLDGLPRTTAEAVR